MAYVAVKGGEKAITNAHRWLAEERRGDPAVAEIEVAQIREQLSLAVDRVMGEGSCYDRDLAALAVKQARGDLPEATFLVRAYRTTLPRFGASEPLDTVNMAVRRRVSAAFKDIPGGQVLGPTFDYTHRLIDFALVADGEAPAPAVLADAPQPYPMPTIGQVFAHEDLLESDERTPDAPEPFDLTREPMSFPAGRDQRLQSLARGDEGFLLSLAYSSQRGWGATHPLCGEIRMGEVAVEFVPEELGFAIDIGEITVTECQMLGGSKASGDKPPQYMRGYGLVFGHSERKAMSMAIVDRALRDNAAESGQVAPVQDEEFVLYHADNVEASGFVQHLKLPHYVDFQADLQTIRRQRRQFFERRALKEAAE
ncbi:carbon-phosphorus lyase complex subunit PhnI [Caulobacter sp. KR2-114]|uniref:carbon-phosphorus lyase complex subunit PhnI n=1 Tax=Caulobacter sp. KR2-114 TaxID=3400912 RepID=UPI003C01A563